MKAKLVLILISVVALAPVRSAAWSESADDSVPFVVIAPSSDLENVALQDVLTIPSALPRGPSDVMHDYEGEMAAITQRFSARLTAIAEAVHRGQLSSAQGQKISAEEYQMAQMQFELLSTWREMLAEDLNRAAKESVQKVAAAESK